MGLGGHLPSLQVGASDGQPPRFFPYGIGSQADHVREPGGPGALQETRGVGLMQRLYTPTALRPVVTIADGAVIGHGQPEDGQDQLARPLVSWVQDQAASSKEASSGSVSPWCSARASLQAVRGRTG